MRVPASLRINWWVGTAAFAAGCSLPFGPPTGSYRDQGVAHYAGKPLIGTVGEFEQLTVSPDGKKAVFVGRESNVAYELFIANVDGPIRKLVATGQSPGDLAWSADGQKVLYRALDVYQPGQPVAVADVPTGEALHVVTIADGSDRKLADVAGRGMAYPSPTLRTLATHDPVDGLQLVDVATGARTPLAGAFGRDRPTLAWLPDESGLFVVEPGAIPDQGRLLRYRAPAWEPEAIGPIHTYPGHPVVQPDGSTLRFLAFEPYTIERDFQVRIRSFVDGVARPDVTLELGRPPSGYDYDFLLASGKQAVLSPDGKRALVHRRAHTTAMDIRLDVKPTPDPNLPPPAAFMLDLPTATLTSVSAAAMPIAWLDDRRVLASTGQGQDKVLSVFEP